MNATINSKGNLEIRSSDGLSFYALKKWLEESGMCIELIHGTTVYKYYWGEDKDE